MSQTLREDKISSKTANEFSDLAWKFNNLNSAAKMLLVGTSSQSVPFIPISELVYDSNSSSSQEKSSAAASLSPQPSSSSIKYSPASAYTNPVIVNATAASLRDNQQTSQEIKPSNLDFLSKYSETSKVASLEKLTHPKIKPAYYEPVATSVTEAIQTKPEFKATSSAEARRKSFEIPVLENEIEQRNYPAYAERAYDEQIQNVNSWSYTRPYNSEEETPYEAVEARKGSFWGPFLKTTGAVTAVALLAIGALRFIKSPKSVDEALESDQDIFKDEALKDSTTEKTISSSESQTFLEEENKSMSPAVQPQKTAIKKDLDREFYKPRITTSPKAIKPNKAKVFKAPNAYKTTQTKRAFNPYTDPTPLELLNEDPSTVYDSSSNNAITPSIYSAEKFPLEVSYTKQGPQVEAAFTPPIGAEVVENSLTAPTVNKTDNSVQNIEEQKPLAEDIQNKPSEVTPNKVYSSYPVEAEENTETSNSTSTNSDVTENLEDTNINAVDSEPILRQPVQSSSNDLQINDTVFASPYSSNAVNMTSTMLPSASPYKASPQSSQVKKKTYGRYTQQYKNEALKNTANTAISNYQKRLNELQQKAESQDLTDNERADLINEVQNLKRSILQTQNELENNQQLVSQQSQTTESKKQLDELEMEANNIYVKPAFDERDPKSMNIGSL
jgi:hypothetical protein